VCFWMMCSSRPVDKTASPSRVDVINRIFMGVQVMTAPFFVKLQNRCLIHIEGEDRYKFLQGLVSNDVDRLPDQKVLYSCLLTAQGKFLHDFFLLEGSDFILLECEGGERTRDLFKRLNMYRLRSKVTLSVEEDIPVYAIFLPSTREQEGEYIDPRHPDMGWRCMYTKPEDIEEKPFEKWDECRIHLTIPDGSRDMEVERSTLLECNIDKLNGVSFDKGCYVGQEITARMHHRGLVKKHLCTVKIDGAVPEPFEDIYVDDKRVGNMRSHCGVLGLALIRDDAFDNMKKKGAVHPVF